MSAAQAHTPEIRLAKILRSLGDPAPAAAADRRTETLEAAVRAYVEEKLREIMVYAEQGEDVLFAECRTLAQACVNLAEVAGAAGFGAVGEIARGIKAMVDNLTTHGVWHTDALRLHLDTLALVSRGEGGLTPENQMILQTLRGMREAVGVVE